MLRLFTIAIVVTATDGEKTYRTSVQDKLASNVNEEVCN